MHEPNSLVLLPKSTRMVQIYNDTLYVSMDDKPGGTGYNRSYIGTLGDPAATSVFTCTGVGGGCRNGLRSLRPGRDARSRQHRRNGQVYHQFARVRQHQQRQQS